MNKKDFYIDSHFICGVRSTDNIFDLPKSLFDCGDFICFEQAVRSYIEPFSVTLYMWPWSWHDSSLTDEAYIYEIDNNRILYYTGETSEFFDAKLVRKRQSLRGCEIFDCNFKFPLMMNIPKT